MFKTRILKDKTIIQMTKAMWWMGENKVVVLLGQRENKT